MGNSFAPHLTSLYVGFWDESLIVILWGTELQLQTPSVPRWNEWQFVLHNGLQYWNIERTTYIYNSLPYILFCGLKRICIRDKCTKEPTRKMDRNQREQLFQRKPRGNAEPILFISKYMKVSEGIKNILQKHWHIQKKNIYIYTDKPIFKRGTNVRYKLVLNTSPQNKNLYNL